MLRSTFTPGDLNAVVAEMEPMLRRAIGEDTALSLSVAPGMCIVRADADEIEQVLMHLVSNARDAMPQGGRLTIATMVAPWTGRCSQTCSSAPIDDCVWLSIADTGCGMDEGTKRQAFDAFFTTKPRGKGTGLGLWTCHGLITRMGGHITVDSAPGSGSTFRICLPRLRRHPVMSFPVAPPGPVSPAGRQTVLVIEDDDRIRVLMQRMLGRQGYRVLSARDAHDAFTIAQQTHGRCIDLVVSDVALPDLPGREAVERVLTCSGDAKVIFMSGHDEDSLQADGRLPAGCQFIRKPFTSESLLRKVREVLRVSR